MKKILILILCMCILLPANVCASKKITVGFDTAEKNSDTYILPFYISDIPDELTDISALTIHFVFDTAVLEFAGLRVGEISPISQWYNLSAKNPGKVIFSWFDSSPQSGNALTEDNIGRTNPIFYAEFKLIDKSAVSTTIDIATVGIHDFDSNGADTEHIDVSKGEIFVYEDIAVNDAYGLEGKSLVKLTSVPEAKIPMINGISPMYFGNGTYAAVVDNNYTVTLEDAQQPPEIAIFGKLHEGGVTAWDALVTNDEALEKDVYVFDDIQNYVLADLDGNGNIEAIDAFNINKISIFKGEIDVPNWTTAK